MRCAKCPLFESWNNENSSGESCGIFGDDWGNKFQYEDKNGTIIGCYIEKAFIDKCENELMEHYERIAEDFSKSEKAFDFDNIFY